MKINTEYKLRQIAGETIIIMQGTHGVDMTKVISLNSTSEWLWQNLCDKEFTLSDVVDLLLSKYEIDRATSEQESRNWIENLPKHGIILHS